MLRDRYEPMNVLALLPAPGMEVGPVLTQIDGLLDDVLFQATWADLAVRHPHTLTDGRPSTPVEVIMRMLVIKHLYGWSYEQTCELVAGSLVLRQFCRVYAQAVPTDTTLLRWANLIRPATLHELRDADGIDPHRYVTLAVLFHPPRVRRKLTPTPPTLQQDPVAIPKRHRQGNRDATTS